jgi:hypothetical protein
MTEIMLILSFIVFVFCCFGFYRIFRQYLIITKMVKKYKKNPELFSLELSTTEDIMNEFHKRGQPFLMLMPMLSKTNMDVESIRVYCGMHPYAALSIMHSVSFMIMNNPGNAE